jgi:rhodanese-related sulfurtransferase
LDLKRPVILIADAGREEEAILRLGRIGFDIVIGYLDGAALAWKDRSDLLSQFERLDALELSQEIEGADAPKILDVRSPGEFAAGHLENALNIPLPELGDRLDEVREAQPMVIHCAGGYRSVIAVSLLEAEGFSGLRDLRGGFEAWTNAHQAVV